MELKHFLKEISDKSFGDNQKLDQAIREQVIFLTVATVLV